MAVRKQPGGVDFTTSEIGGKVGENGEGLQMHQRPS